MSNVNDVFTCLERLEKSIQKIKPGPRRAELLMNVAELRLLIEQIPTDQSISINPANVRKAIDVATKMVNWIELISDLFM